jgi:squalene-hopene/tetraprenyl-beta-curcumene cyclase
MNTIIGILVSSLTLSGGPSTSTSAQDSETAQQSINREKITRSTPPPAATSVTSIGPPMHRISQNAEACGVSEKTARDAKRMIDEGLAWLMTRQNPNGLWLLETQAQPSNQPDWEETVPVDLAVSALVMKALAQTGESTEELQNVTNGVIMGTGLASNDFNPSKGGKIGTYVASTIVSGLSSLGDLQQHDRMQEAIAWLRASQWHAEDQISPEEDWYGGVGYGKHGRPDLSNTQMMLEALHDAGVSPEDPAIQEALVFVSRSQNLKETNPSAWAQAGSNDGGFIYTPANGGESMASQYVGEGRYGELLLESDPRRLRSYGSMTYAGFKSLLHAGLNENDPRVEAAMEWIRNNWTLKENPGVGQQGLYYYFHAVSRALTAAGWKNITTEDGVEHDWREELVEKLESLQRPDGSWVNPEDRWLESEAILTTAYSILALEEILKPVRADSRP